MWYYFVLLLCGINTTVASAIDNNNGNSKLHVMEDSMGMGSDSDADDEIDDENGDRDGDRDGDGENDQDIDADAENCPGYIMGGECCSKRYVRI